MHSLKSKKKKISLFPVSIFTSRLIKFSFQRLEIRKKYIFKKKEKKNEHYKRMIVFD